MRFVETSGFCSSASRTALAASQQARAQQKQPVPGTAPRPTATAAAFLRRNEETVLCGQGRGLPCLAPNAGLSGLGLSFPGSGTVSNVACGELQDVLAPMGRSLAEAKRIGVTGMVVGDAQEFYKRETTFSTATNPWLPQKCRDLVNDGTVRLRALNAAIAAVGGQPAAPPAEPGSGGAGSGGGGGFFSDWMGTIKTVAIAGAVIAGVVVVAPVVWEVVAARKASRGR